MNFTAFKNNNIFTKIFQQRRMLHEWQFVNLTLVLEVIAIVRRKDFNGNVTIANATLPHRTVPSLS